MIFYLSKNKNRMNQILNGLNIENDIINISDIDEPNEFIKNIEKYNKNKNKIKLQDLEEISSTKDLFLSGISHEVRTPLNAIIGFSNILQSNERLTNEELEYIDIINNNAKDLLSFLSEHIDIINKINIKEKENLINKINTRIKILLFEKTSNDIENSFNNIIKSKDMFDLTKSNDSNIILNNIKEYYFDIIIIDLDDLEKNDNNLLKNIEIFEKENMNKLLKIGITYHNKYKVKNSICDYYLTNCYTKPLKDDDILYILNLTLFN
jgi:signal transduction histidine kinase